MSLTGPTIIAGNRPLRIVTLVGVSAKRGPSYGAGGAVLTMATSGKARRGRRVVGAGTMLLGATGFARLRRRVSGTGTLALTTTGAARRRRRGTASTTLSLTTTANGRRGRYTAGSTSVALSTAGAGYVRPGWAAPGSVLDLDLKGNRAYRAYSEPTTLASVLTVTRSSAAYIDDSAGNWTLVPANTLRRSDKGALIEGAQTNSIRNNSMQGAVVGSPGTLPTNWTSASWDGITPSVVGKGVENGVDYIDVRFQGTTVAGGAATGFSFEPIGVISAAAGQLWTESVFLKLVSGTVGNFVIPINITSWLSNNTTLVDSFIGANLGPQLTASLARFSLSGTLTGSPTSVQPRLRLVTPAGAGVAVDFTLRIGWPQLEQWSTSVTTVGGPSSPIRTTGTAATRAADVIKASQTVPSAVTAAIIGASYLGGGGTRILGGFSNSASPAFAESIYYTGSSTGAVSVNMRSGGTGVNSLASAAGSTNRNAMVFSAAANDIAVSVNGGAASASSIAQAFPNTVNQLIIGSSPWANDNPWYGYIERLAVYPSRLTNAQLQTLSTLAYWGG